MRINHTASPSVSSPRVSRREFALAAAGALFSGAVLAPRAEAARLEERTVNDSLGRQVVLPGRVDAVTPLGVHAQTMMMTLLPEGLASLATGIDDDIDDYAEAELSEVSDLPETGGIASSATEDVSASGIRRSGCELMLDAGVYKEGLESDLDSLERAAGKPCVFLDIGFGKLPTAYRVLGEVLGCRKRAEKLAAFIEGAQDKASRVFTRADAGCRVFYAPRAQGTMVRGGIEVQIDAIRAVGATPILEPYDYEGKTVDFERMEAANVDLVVFDDTDVLAPLSRREGDAFALWKGVPAVAQGRFAVSPALMHSWFGSIVLVQSLGVLWLASVIWPDACDYDISKEARNFYELFYGLERGSKAMGQLVGEYEDGGYSNE